MVCESGSFPVAGWPPRCLLEDFVAGSWVRDLCQFLSSISILVSVSNVASCGVHWHLQSKPVPLSLLASELDACSLLLGSIISAGSSWLDRVMVFGVLFLSSACTFRILLGWLVMVRLFTVVFVGVAFY